MTQPDQLSHAFNDGKDDTWGTSGCHAVCMTMILNWYVRQNPLTHGKLQVPNMKGEKPDKMTPLFAAHWLWDPQSDPKQTTFVSSTQHPPYVPKKDAKVRVTDRTTGKFKCYAWQMDHIAIRKAMEKVTFKGEPLTLDVKNRGLFTAHDLQQNPDKVRAARQLKKSDLKRMLLRGPVALNMHSPGHYVLLYGYRGSTMYICDPGSIICNNWVNVQPDVASAPAQMIHENKNVVAIDGEALFSHIGGGELAFLDCVGPYEGFYFPSLGEMGSYNDTRTPTNIGPFPSMPKKKLTAHT